MNSEQKLAVIGIVVAFVLTIAFFIWCKPDTADPLITLVNTLLTFLGGVFGVVVSAVTGAKLF